MNWELWILCLSSGSALSVVAFKVFTAVEKDLGVPMPLTRDTLATFASAGAIVLMLMFIASVCMIVAALLVGAER